MIEVILPVPAAQIDALEDALLEYGETRWMLTQDLPTASAQLIGLFEKEAAGRNALDALVSAWPIFSDFGPATFRNVVDQDWRDSYKAHFKAWRFGRLHWVPTWERRTYSLPPGDQVIWLDPGLAFGTGNHETTRLCCERLVEMASEKGLQRRVIDAGCGSGILALSAAALGFSSVVGFDNDPVAVTISEENAVANGHAQHVGFFAGDLDSGLKERCADILLANIQADVLMRFSGRLLSAVDDRGSLILSGILAREIEQVRTHFEQAAPSWKTDSRIMGEWADLFLERSN